MPLEDYLLDIDQVKWEQVLHEWSWAFPREGPVEVWFMTRFATVFLVLEDQTVWCLDPSEGVLEKVGKNREAFINALDEEEGHFSDFFMPELVEKLVRQGKNLDKNQCYGFVTPLGFDDGAAKPKNVTITNPQEYLLKMGRLWAEVHGHRQSNKLRFDNLQ